MDVDTHYDKDNDMLDIVFGLPQKAITEQVDDRVYLRLCPESEEIVGMVIIPFTKWFAEKVRWQY